MKKYLEIGQIVGTHGLRGELRVQPWCNNPEFMEDFDKFYLDENGKNSINLISCRPHGNIVLLILDGVDSIDKAASMKNTILFIDRNDYPLEEGDYFIQDLEGCTVFDVDTEKKLGILSQVSTTGANDVWHIANDEGKEYLIPAIPDVVIDIDIEKGIIKIRPLRGIFDDEN